MIANAPMDVDAWWALTRWQIATDTGMSLREIDRMPIKDISEYLSVKDALAKIEQQKSKRKGKK